MHGRRRIKRCPVPKSTFTTFMDEGTMHYRAGHFRKSLFCFDRALELRPSDKAALVARSQCHLKLGDAESALKDAESSFDEHTVYIMGLFQYAEALFSLGSFEKALIAFSRGRRLRKDMEGFRIGIQKCIDAITTAIGDKTSTQIEDFDDIQPIIEEMEALKNAKQEHCCIRPDPNEELRKRRFELKPPSYARSRWVAREVLGQMYVDKDYLTKFLKRQDVQSDQGQSAHLRRNANEALGFLKIREEFWRQQNPMYSRKHGLNYNNNMVIQYEEQERVRQEQCRRIKMEAAEGAIVKNLSLIEHALSIGRPKDCQLECERSLRQMKKITKTVLPRKPEFYCQILHYKGLALLQLKNYDAAADAFHTEFNTAVQEKMIDIKSRALDYLGKAFAQKKSYAEAAEIWETRLSLTKVPVERAYLFHEIGVCYMSMHKLDMSKYYANQCLEESTRIDDQIWAMNARILLGQIESKGNQREGICAINGLLKLALNSFADFSIVKNMNLETASAQFEIVNSLATKLGNNHIQAMAEEAIQCLKVWMERREKEEVDRLERDREQSPEAEPDPDYEVAGSVRKSLKGEVNAQLPI